MRGKWVWWRMLDSCKLEWGDGYDDLEREADRWTKGMVDKGKKHGDEMTTRLHENRDRGHAEWRRVHGYKHNGQATSRHTSTSSQRLCLVVCNLGYLLTVKAWRKLKRHVLIITENPDSSHKEAMAWRFTESSWDFGALSMHSGRKRKQGDNRITIRRRTWRL